MVVRVVWEFNYLDHLCQVVEDQEGMLFPLLDGRVIEPFHRVSGGFSLEYLRGYLEAAVEELEGR